MEKNISSYELEQSNNKKYILTSSLINDKLKLTTQDSDSQTFTGTFSLSDLCNISQYFKNIKNIEQVQNYLNRIIEKQMVEISQNEFSAQIIVHLINSDSIIIPLANKIENNNYNYMYNQSEYIDKNSNPITQTTNNYSNISYDYTTNQFINNNASEFIIKSPKKSNMNINTQTLYTNTEFPSTNIGQNNINTQNNMIFNAEFSNLTYNKMNNANNKNFIDNARPKTPTNQNIIPNNNIKKAKTKIRKEKEKANIKPKREIISKEIKQLTERVENYINEIDSFKKEKSNLIEDAKKLKMENEKLRAQVKDFKSLIKEYQVQSESLKNQFDAIQNSILSSGKKNTDIKKIKEQYDKENLELKNNLDKISSENSDLKTKISKLEKDLKKEKINKEKEINNIKKEFKKDKNVDK